MAMNRRRFVAAAAVSAVGAVAARTAGRVEPAIAAAVPVLRPASLGTSAGRCAHCGSLDHSTLDVTCPEAAETRRAVQSAARRLGEQGRRSGT